MCFNQTKQGFTLIELLVVVLIIGILSAVALPQYQYAVRKTNFTAIMPAVEAIYQAENIFKLNNGFYVADFNSLDVSLPGQKPFSVGENGMVFSITYDKGYCVLATTETNTAGYIICSKQKHIGSEGYGRWLQSDEREGKRVCVSKNETSENFCKKFTENSTSFQNGVWTVFPLPN